MEKAVIIASLIETIKGFGFDTHQDSNESIPCIVSDYASIGIIEQNDIDVANRKLTVAIVAKASIGRMGGDMTPDELIDAANELICAAKLVEKINEMNMKYELNF